MVFTLFGIEKPPVAEEGGVATEGKVASGDAGRLPTPYFCYYGLVSFGGERLGFDCQTRGLPMNLSA